MALAGARDVVDGLPGTLMASVAHYYDVGQFELACREIADYMAQASK